MKIQNPHDKFFKEVFSKVSVAKDFLQHYLPHYLVDIVDMDTLEPQKDSFINKELNTYFSDLLFKVDIGKDVGYLYFLFEHKSYPSKDISLQLLTYMVEIWKSKVNNQNSNQLPIIIPLVIYHGKERWKLHKSLSFLINGYDNLTNDVRKHIPNYEYLLYDLSTFTDEEIRGEVINKITITMLRDIQNKSINEIIASFLKASVLLNDLESQQTGIEYFETLIRYLFNVRNDFTSGDINNMLDKLEHTYPEGREKIMTIAEILRQEGLEKGRQAGSVGIIIRFLITKFGKLPEDIKNKLLDLDLTTLEVMAGKILNFGHLDDVRMFLESI